jgi:histidyl-tRNA synthetase
MRDVLPIEARRWRHIETGVTGVLRRFGYEEVQLPLLEFTELFASGVGEATDIVEKEMYTMLDRDGDSLSLRPEGTASCVRALQEHGLLYNQTQKVFYAGPMFRYEKPQKGRYRQFYQIGAEAFGFHGPDVDAELILLGAEFWRALGIHDHVRLELNTLGSGAARQAYREALVAYLTPLEAQLDADSQRRLRSNPLRILDSKNEQTQEILSRAPKLPDFVDDDSQQHFAQLLESLDALGIAYTCNPNLVRGLDYYTHTVFEWITDDLGSQGTVCAGGRYNGLVERLGGRATPAAGFALGLERALLLHEVVHQDQVSAAVDIYVCYGANELSLQAQLAGLRIRHALGADGLTDLKVRVHMGGGNFKKQLKRANASGARWAVLLGNNEIEANQLTLKDLLSGEQETLAEGAVVQRIVAGTSNNVD